MAEQWPKFKAAAVQAAPVFLDREATLEKAVKLIEEAAGEGAKFIVFPETWVPGFPFWYLYVFRWNYPPAKKAYARLFKNSVDVPGPFTEALGEAAKRTGVYLAIGVNERVSSGTLYNTLVFIGKDGSLMGKHRKLVPTFHERMVWAKGDGSTLQVFNTELGRLSGLICWEHFMPLARYALYAQGMQVSASSWPWGHHTSLAVSQHLAFEGKCFVVMAGAYMTQADLPSDFELAQDLEKEIKTLPKLFKGGSTIIGPDGKCLVEPVYGCEAIVCADIDLERIIEEKQALDVVGHYARPEVLKRTVNRQPFSPFQTVGEDIDIKQELSSLEALAEEAPREVLRENIRKLGMRLRGEGIERTDYNIDLSGESWL